MNQESIALLMRQHSVERIEQEQRQFESGKDDMALLAAIRECFAQDIAPPDWVKKAFIRAYDKVLSCRVGSWDEAFGAPYPGKHIDSLWMRRTYRWRVFTRVLEIRRKKNSAWDECLKDVAAELNIGLRLCTELWNETKNLRRGMRLDRIKAIPKKNKLGIKTTRP